MTRAARPGRAPDIWRMQSACGRDRKLISSRCLTRSVVVTHPVSHRAFRSRAATKTFLPMANTAQLRSNGLENSAPDNRTEVLQNVPHLFLAFSGSESLAFAAYPATLKVRSLQGGREGFSARLQRWVICSCLPAEDMLLGILRARRTVNLIMSDADAVAAFDGQNGARTSTTRNIRFLTIPRSPDFTAASPVHAGDASPVQVAAQRGYLGIVEGSQELRMYSKRRARLQAAT